MSNWAEQPIRKFRIPKWEVAKPCPLHYTPMKGGVCPVCEKKRTDVD